MNKYGNYIICNEILIEVALFNTIEYVCPQCNPERIPKKTIQEKIDEEFKKKCGFNELNNKKEEIDKTKEETKKLTNKDLADLWDKAAGEDDDTII